MFTLSAGNNCIMFCFYGIVLHLIECFPNKIEYCFKSMIEEQICSYINNHVFEIDLNYYNVIKTKLPFV